MSLVYHIKKATSVPDEGEELMEHIYNCCISGNPKNKKIHSSGSSTHIQTDIQYTELPDSMSQYQMSSRIHNMHCENLSNQYISRKLSDAKCCSLITFTDRTLNDIHTILSFSFSAVNECIEVETFCCNGRGGGTLFNFLINAVKCGISECKKDYERTIILSALKEALGFYDKYGFETVGRDREGMDVLARQLTQDSEEHIISEKTRIDDSHTIQNIYRRINEFYFLRLNPKRNPLYPPEIIRREMVRASENDDVRADPDYVPSPDSDGDNMYLRRRGRTRGRRRGRSRGRTRGKGRHSEKASYRSRSRSRSRDKKENSRESTSSMETISFGGKTRKLR